jgi:peptidoglycan/LPS O-acetylase OafA/YrhL
MCWLTAADGPLGGRWKADVMILASLKILVAVLLVLPAVVLAGRQSLPRRFLGAGPVLWVGRVSYGLYLWQVPVLRRVVKIDGFNRSEMVTCPFAAVVALAIAAASWYLMEKRVLDRVHRRIADRQSNPPRADRRLGGSGSPG